MSRLGGNILHPASLRGLVLDELNWKVKLTTLDAINGKAELKAGSRTGSKSMSP